MLRLKMCTIILWWNALKLGDCLMDISIVPALAGLTGAAIGGLTSGIASWFAQKTQSRVQLLAQDKVPRQELYKEFIEAATQCYADALQHEKPDIPGLVNLYGKIGRMRVLSSPRVLASAEQIGQKIINMYLEPNKTFFELREMVNKNAIDILGNFGEACREEFRLLHMFESWPIGGGHRKKVRDRLSWQPHALATVGPTSPFGPKWTFRLP